MKKTYNIGLDIGTNSVGWAVTDSQYNLLKFKNKNMWGVRLFDPGKTAEARRISRGNRRRLNRRRERVALLQQLLGEDVEKVDKTFFIRLKESFLHLEDRQDKNNKFNLFIGKEFTDKDYYKKYPTIYHLRRDLIENTDKKDIRIVYLALHNIIKYRGHFLFEGQSFDTLSGNIEEKILELINEAHRLELGDIQLSSNEIKDIISDKSINRQKKVEKLINGDKLHKNQLKEIFSGILGLTINLKNIFEDVVFENKVSFKFSDDDIDSKLDQVQSLLGDDMEIILIMKEIYSWSVLGSILNGEKYISFAKQKSYEKFKKELKMLKTILVHYDYEFYEEIFKSKKEGPNYETYIKNRDNNVSNKTAKDAFYNNIKNFIKAHLEDDYLVENKNYILNEIAIDNFLVIQNTKDNSTIPYQLNEMELIQILENQGQYYPTIKKNKDKILKLLNFKIPYYVGPLNQHSEFAWVQKIKGMENEKIYPWNIDQIVDIDLSAEKFIKRMTNKCTYLTKEDVLPRNSLLFSDYMYYNEINKIRINGHKLDNALKEDLKEKVFLKKKVVSEKDIANWYKNNHQLIGNECTVEGLQGDKKAASSLTPYIDFTNIFGQIDSSNREIVEKIIEWITVFEDKKILKRKITLEYPDIAADEQKIKKILKLKYKGWSRLSKKLLSDLYTDKLHSTKMSIIDILKETDLNFMQIITNKKFGFDKKIQEENKIEKNTKITYDNLIKDLQGSPAIKRGVWQSIQIIEEIIKIMGAHPKNIFIEFAREDQESKRTLSRKSKLEKLYAELGEVYDTYLNSEAKTIIKDKDTKIDNNRKLLYFMQLGKCMYTGEPLDFDQLNSYETDHIIYQSLIKDDSIDNIVLVKAQKNQERSNQVMPVTFVPKHIQVWWEFLKEKGLISSKKYNNLMRRELSRYEVEGFLNRQLVETRQISKHVTNILSNCYEKEGTRVVSIKAALVDDFRKQFNIYKNRTINDYHHAQDAFIASVVGIYTLNRFPSLEKEFLYNEYKKYSNFTDNRRNKYGFIIGSMNNTYEKDGQCIWEKSESLGKIKKQLNYKDCNITKRVCEHKGEFFNITLQKKLDHNKKSSNPIPIKKNLDVHKYGYYTGEQIAYSSIIQYKKGKKIVKSLVAVPIRYSKQIGNSTEKLKEYFEQVQKLQEVTIIKDKIYKYQLFRNSKGLFYLASTNEWHNAKQLLLDNKSQEITYKMSHKKYSDEISDEHLIYVYDNILEKLEKYYLEFSTVATTLTDNKEFFIKLSKEDKIRVILEMLKITTANATNGNLKLINATNRAGRLSSKTINLDDTTFIYPSITGLYVVEEKY